MWSTFMLKILILDFVWFLNDFPEFLWLILGVHAVAYTMWIVSFNFNVLFNNILHYHSGIINLSNIVSERNPFSQWSLITLLASKDILHKSRYISDQLSAFGLHRYQLFHLRSTVQRNGYSTLKFCFVLLGICV